MTTPQDDLRAAARLLRETARKATFTGWTETDDTVWIGGSVWGYSIPKEGVLHPGDLAWFALAHPGLADPWADILDTAADLLDAQPELGRTHIDGEPCTDLACRIVTSALTAARAIKKAGAS